MPSGLVETVHIHTLYFLIYTYLDPPRVHTQFSFQVLVGKWGKKSHPTGGFRYTDEVVVQQFRSEFLGIYFKKVTKNSIIPQPRSFCFQKVGVKCLKSIELFFTRRRNIKFVEVEICIWMQVEYTLGLGS